ncbi:DivIVA domain-containing protein [Desulfitibacter alkalitolerans]|uniref:DivIVA domain-containing protein n=1 Tax=Desulfitibacter alkalitolerans TaxID=264641 RepID=UPI00068534AE|nr:DivIVA domain-containing protein [Desulfitibacter alkalitolerans]
MAITPLDIQNAEFRVVFRGYSQSEVDSFLNKILMDYEKIYKENQVIKEELKRLEDDIGKYKNIENNLSATLVIAQKTADTLKETAGREAKLIIQEADLKAKRMIEEAQKKVQEKEEELQGLINQFNSYKLKILSLLETQYRMIKDDASTSIPQDGDAASARENAAKQQTNEQKVD